MARFYKVSWVVFVIQMSIQFSSQSTYDIYRGDTDTFSCKKFGRKDGNCSCDNLETLTYGYHGSNKKTRKCVSNDYFRKQSQCRQFSNDSNDIAIQIVHLKDSETHLKFDFSNAGTCEWNSMEYTVHGDNKDWLHLEGNPGNISVQRISFIHTLQISNPSELLSRFPGMLLKLQIECRVPIQENPINKICFLLKIEGQTNLTAYPILPTTQQTDVTTSADFSTNSATATTSSTPSTMSSPTSSPTSSSTSSSTSSPASSSTLSLTSSTTSTLMSSTLSPTSQISETPVKSRDEGLNTNASPITTDVPRLPISTTIIPSDPENGESEGDENDSISLVPILVPTLLLSVLIVVLFGVFLYRRRQRSVSTSIDKDVYDEYSLPDHATLTKPPKDSSQSYAMPGSQIYTTAIYDTIYESTNVPVEDGDYATCDDPIPTIPEVNQNPADHISPQSSYTNPSTYTYQDIHSNQAPESTANSKDNLGYLDQSNESPYYHSLEKDTSNENIYERVAEDPQEHIYNVLEKPN